MDKVVTVHKLATKGYTGFLRGGGWTRCGQIMNRRRMSAQWGKVNCRKCLAKAKQRRGD